MNERVVGVDYWHGRVAARFGDAAHSYDDHSAAQRHAATSLAGRIVAASLPPRPRVLEIGCGTGHLTARLADRLPGASIVATDIAPAMVAACQRRLGSNPRLEFTVMDGTRPDTSAPFDVICASLAAQWFADLPGALARLAVRLAPGGLLALCIPGAATFREWRVAHERLGLVPGALALPSAATIRAALPADGAARIAIEHWHDRPPHGLDFLRGLRAIGAHTAAPGHTPLPPAQLRRVLSALGPQPVIGYELIHLLWRKGG